MYVSRGVKIMGVEKVGQLGHCPFEQAKGEINHIFMVWHDHSCCHILYAQLYLKCFFVWL